MNRLLLTALSLMLYAGLQHEVDGSSAEERKSVVRFLKGRSHPLVRPDGEGGAGTPVVVHVRYSNVRVFDVDAEKLSMKTNGFFQMRWKDRRLSYDHMRSYRGEGFNVSTVRLDVDSIWHPDIELYSTDYKGAKDLMQTRMAVVMPEGDCIFVPYYLVGSNCDPPANHRITCRIQIGSWTYSEDELDLQVEPEIEVKSVSPKIHWRLESAHAHREVKHFSCCPEGYISVDFVFNFVEDEGHHDEGHHADGH